MKNFLKIVFFISTIFFSIKIYQIYNPEVKRTEGILPKNQPSIQSTRNKEPKYYDFNQRKDVADTKQDTQSTSKSYDDFSLALEHKNDEKLNLILSKIDINQVLEDQMTPFLLLVNEEKLQIIEQIIDEVENIDQSNAHGATALTISIGAGNFEISKLLLARGANPNVTYNKRDFTLLMDVAFEGNLPLAQLLIEKGADLNKQDKEGYSPLIIAAKQGHTALVKYFLANGANRSARDLKGLTAKDHAIMNDHKDLIEEF